jgi:hypothetical protein
MSARPATFLMPTDSRAQGFNWRRRRHLDSSESYSTWHAAAPRASWSTSASPPANTGPCLSQLNPSRDVARPTTYRCRAASKLW